MIIADITPFSTIDYPDHIGCVLWTQGCNVGCKYCHNKTLTSMKTTSEYHWDSILEWLNKRLNRLQAVTFSGGEPLLQKDILPYIKDIKDLGFKVGLHTSGVYTERLREIIHLVDWIGIDFKAPINQYLDICNAKGDKVYESLKLLVKEHNNFEVRTTLYPYFHTKEIVRIMCNQLVNIGIDKIVFQYYRDANNITYHVNYDVEEVVKDLMNNIIIRK